MMLPPMMVASGTCNKELYRNKRCDAPLRIDSSGAGNKRYAVSKLTDDNSKQKANVREGFLAMLETCFPETRSGDGKAAGDRTSGTGAAHAGAGTGGNGPEYHFTPEMSEEEARAYAPLTLAFLGDAVYELALRTMLVQRADMRPNELNRRSSLLAKAHAQSYAMEAIEPLLDETEADIYRRGRNAKSHTMAKNATMGDYRRATGFEALMGYLYLAGKQERMMELIQIAVAKNGQ